MGIQVEMGIAPAHKSTQQQSTYNKYIFWEPNIFDPQTHRLEHLHSLLGLVTLNNPINV